MHDKLKAFDDRGHTASVMGSHAFLHWLRKSQLREVEDKVLVTQVFPGSLAIAAIIQWVAAYYSALTFNLLFPVACYGE